MAVSEGLPKFGNSAGAHRLNRTTQEAPEGIVAAPDEETEIVDDRTHRPEKQSSSGFGS
jgi:hypothetical protein